MTLLNLRFGEFIAYRRKQIDLKQKDLKGISRSYVGTIEIGEQFPRTVKTMQLLYDGLNIFALDRSFEWFRAYALFDKNPDKIFGKTQHIDNPLIVEAIEKLEGLPDAKIQQILSMIDVLLAT